MDKKDGTNGTSNAEVGKQDLGCPKRWRISADVWNEMYRVWRDEKPSRGEMAVRFNVGLDTVTKYVHEGAPAKHWPSFNARKLEEDRTHSDAAQQAGEAIAKTMLDDYELAREKNIKLFNAGYVVLATIMTRLHKELVKIDWSPMPAPQFMSQVLRPIMEAMRTNSQMMALWTGGPTSRLDHTAKGVPLLDQETIDYIEKNGDLPQGMSIAEFSARFQATFAAPAEPKN